jgi:hypothetical protein
MSQQQVETVCELGGAGQWRAAPPPHHRIARRPDPGMARRRLEQDPPARQRDLRKLFGLEAIDGGLGDLTARCDPCADPSPSELSVQSRDAWG